MTVAVASGTPERPERRRGVAVGVMVTIVTGRLRGASGRVEAVERNPTCGCLSVFVSTPAGEWVGAPSEVVLHT